MGEFAVFKIVAEPEIGPFEHRAGTGKVIQHRLCSCPPVPIQISLVVREGESLQVRVSMATENCTLLAIENCT
ncbi:MAG: hypothetical protein OXK20_03160, partial [Deltaproteobacteria bacterium]|nr:hypothetical protein [Deltaproteobacteria bacterium]